MTNKPSSHLFAPPFEQFDYQIVYLRPSQHSDERIAVGLVSESNAGLEARFIGSVSSLELMSRMFGESGVEQFHFAADELRRAARSREALGELAVPTDLLLLGEKTSAVTRDREGLLKGVLASASCLVRGESARVQQVSDESAAQLCTQLYEQVTLLNPLVANDLFRRRITVGTGDAAETISLPIFGKRVFGAPVSFLTPGWDQKVRAEAHVAKFRWLRQFLSQEPNVYVLCPERGAGRLADRSDSQVRELQAVADASEVNVRVSSSTEELASIIVNAEAA